MDVLIAHMNEDGDIQTIKEHLQGTAEKSKEFAEEFGCGDVGYLCGLMHDIGKYSVEFQKRIRDPENSKRVDHSTAGAKELCHMSNNYIPMAMVVAGHHSGLLDGGLAKLAQAQDGTFFGRLKTDLPEYGDWKRDVIPLPASVPVFCTKGRRSIYAMFFFIRMIYSCLVDADYLDTEAFIKQNAVERAGGDSIGVLLERFRHYIAPWVERTAFESTKQKLLFENRTKILLNCMEKGETAEKGVYTLTVPTGGGKTTASLGFALEHAKTHNMKRVIYVIPYTSIIDQNAGIFSEILGEENVLEDHCAVQFEVVEKQVQDVMAYQKILATENWDRPIIVTTAVQFFESLYACKSSRCRKLHNIANSVVIFDEAQTIPISYLKPCVAAISELVEHYGITAVLCTATQPMLEDVFQKYLQDMSVHELCDDIENMHKRFERTCIKHVGVLKLQDLLDRLAGKQQYLCIVNKRKTAQELYMGIEAEGAYCLTTLLYPAARKAKIIEIRKRLANGLPCRVIATSLVEAGVDLDFPEVFRQETGLDSVLQAAGRCNREGKRKAEDSIVTVFQLEGDKTVFLEQNISALQWTQKKYKDMASQEAIAFYFRFYRELLGQENLDQKEIMKAIEKGVEGKVFPFATIAERFRLIENEMATIYIPLGEGEALVNALTAGRLDRNGYRKLGQYGVNVYLDHLNRLWTSGCLERIGDAGFILRDLTQYCQGTGLRMTADMGNGFFV